MYKRINGIQHIGVGTADSDKSQKWYRKFLGMDVRLFDGTAPAPLMDIYTNNETITKRASMILNLQGGCAMEVVNPTTFTAKPADFEVQLGDLGIYVAQVKTQNVQKAYAYFKQHGATLRSDIVHMPEGSETFYVEDPNGLFFQIVEDLIRLSGSRLELRTPAPRRAAGRSGSDWSVGIIRRGLP